MLTKNARLIRERTMKDSFGLLTPSDSQDLPMDSRARKITAKTTPRCIVYATKLTQIRDLNISSLDNAECSGSMFARVFSNFNMSSSDQSQPGNHFDVSLRTL